MALNTPAGSESPSAAYLAGQQHGQQLATQHAAAKPAASKPAAAPNKPAAPTKPAAKPAGTGGGVLDFQSLLAQAQQLAQAETAAQIKAIQDQQAMYTQQGQDRASNINAAAKAAADYLSGLGNQTSSSYTDAAKALGALAQGFTGQVGADATSAANQVQQNLAALGAPAGSAKTPTGQTSQPADLQNVLYGLGGFIPGNLLLTSGQAAANVARALPASTLAEGQTQASGTLAAAQKQADTLTPDLLKAQAGQPSLARQIYGSLLSGVKTQAGLQNQAFDQAYKTAEYQRQTANDAFNQKATIQRLNNEAIRISNAQFNADRTYQVSLAKLGISQKRLQMTIVQNAFKAAHGGYTAGQLKKIQTQALGFAQQAFNGTTKTVTHTAGGVTTTHNIDGFGRQSYGQAMTSMLKKGWPVQTVLAALDQVYGKPNADQQAEIAKALGPLAPAALTQAIQQATATQGLAGLSITSPATILTQTAPQTRAVKAYAFNNAAAKYGWGDNANLAALDRLWTQESGWNPNAVNRSSGAAGIPQALGHGHVFNLGDYKAQVDWGLNYIRQRYGSPLAAWQHEVANNWY